MANIKQLKENNQNIYPVTHEQAVMDNDGVSISEKLASYDNVYLKKTDIITEAEIDAIIKNALV